MLDDLASRVRHSDPPPWDDLREQRVLQGALDLGRRQLARRRRALPVAIGSSVVLAVAVAVLVWSRSAVHPSATVAAANSAPPAGSMIDLVDGCRAWPETGATLRVAEQRRDRVRVVQVSGSVLYDVKHDPERAFVVQAADVRVRVHGTRFSVALADEWVDVHVERGRVDVHDGARTTALVSGERLRVHAWTATAAASASTRAAEPTAAAVPAAAVPAAAVPAAAVPAAPAQVPVTAASLLARADEARRAGRADEAAEALRTLLSRFPSDSRVPVALFTLGRLQSALGRPTAAAEAFARCRRSAGGSLGEDALAEEATARAWAGDARASRSLARQYLDRYPKGTHARRMQALSR
ncbi:MAG: FecR domain-containing protein [Polyangiaceae bacterium]|nr:FecR domain-containing protein [Polyangiaceae bacterium]